MMKTRNDIKKRSWNIQKDFENHRTPPDDSEIIAFLRSDSITEDEQSRTKLGRLFLGALNSGQGIYIKRVMKFVMDQPGEYFQIFGLFEENFENILLQNKNLSTEPIDALFQAWTSHPELSRLPIKSKLASCIFSYIKHSQSRDHDVLLCLIKWYEVISTYAEQEMILCQALSLSAERTHLDFCQTLLEHLQESGFIFPVFEDMNMELGFHARLTIRKCSLKAANEGNVTLLAKLTQICGNVDVCTPEVLEVLMNSSRLDVVKTLLNMNFPTFSIHDLKNAGADIFVESSNNSLLCSVLEFVSSFLNFRDLMHIAQTSKYVKQVVFSLPVHVIGKTIARDIWRSALAVEDQDEGISEQVLNVFVVRSVVEPHGGMARANFAKVFHDNLHSLDLYFDKYPIINIPNFVRWWRLRALLSLLVNDENSNTISSSSLAKEHNDDEEEIRLDLLKAAFEICVQNHYMYAMHTLLECAMEIPVNQFVHLIEESFMYAVHHSAHHTVALLLRTFGGHNANEVCELPTTCVFEAVDQAVIYNRPLIVRSIFGFLVTEATSFTQSSDITLDDVRNCIFGAFSHVTDDNEEALQALIYASLHLFHLGYALTPHQYSLILGTLDRLDLRESVQGRLFVRHVENLYGTQRPGSTRRFESNLYRMDSTTSSSSTEQDDLAGGAAYVYDSEGGTTEHTGRRGTITSNEVEESVSPLQTLHTRRRRGSSVEIRVALDMEMSAFDSHDHSSREDLIGRYLLEAVREDDYDKTMELINLPETYLTMSSLLAARNEAHQLKFDFILDLLDRTIHSMEILHSERFHNRNQKINLLDFHDDIYGHVALFLDLESILNFGTTCKRIYTRERLPEQVIHVLIGDYLAVKRIEDDDRFSIAIPKEISRLIPKNSSNGSHHTEFSLMVCRSALNKLMHMAFLEKWSNLTELYSLILRLSCERECDWAAKEVIRCVFPSGEYAIPKEQFTDSFRRACKHGNKKCVVALLRDYVERNSQRGLPSVRLALMRMEPLHIVDCAREAALSNNLGLVSTILIPLLQIVSDSTSPAARQLALHVNGPRWGTAGLMMDAAASAAATSTSLANNSIEESFPNAIIPIGPGGNRTITFREFMESLIRTNQAWILGQILKSGAENGHENLCKSIIAMAIMRGLGDEAMFLTHYGEAFVLACRGGHVGVVHMICNYEDSSGRVYRRDVISREAVEAFKSSARNGFVHVCSTLKSSGLVQFSDVAEIFVDCIRRNHSNAVLSILTFDDIPITLLENCLSQAKLRGHEELMEPLENAIEKLTRAQLASSTRNVEGSMDLAD